MACFADINVSQGSVATHARCGWLFDIHLTANLPRNLPVKKKFLNRLRVDRTMVMSLWPQFLAHPVWYSQSPWTGRTELKICNPIVKQVSVRLPTYADSVALPAFARRYCQAPGSNQSISPAHRADSSKRTANLQTDGQTDRQTDTVPLHKPISHTCSAKM